MRSATEEEEVSSQPRAEVSRLDDDDDDSSPDDAPLPPRSNTKRLLYALLSIDNSSFPPTDRGGKASIRSLIYSKRLRRATGIAVRYEAISYQDSVTRCVPWAFVLFTANSMCFEITKVVCHFTRRRKGYARECLRSVFAFAKTKKVSSVRLRVETTNDAAIALYQSLGFSEDKNRAITGYYGEGRDAAVYEACV